MYFSVSRTQPMSTEIAARTRWCRRRTRSSRRRCRPPGTARRPDRGRRSRRGTTAGPPRRPTAARRRPRRSSLGRRRRTRRGSPRRAPPTWPSCASWSTPRRSITSRILAQHREVRSMRRRVERAGGVDPLAEAGDAHQPLDASACRRASTTAASSWCRSRSRRRRQPRDVSSRCRGVDRPRAAGRRPTRPTGSSPPARNQA